MSPWQPAPWSFKQRASVTALHSRISVYGNGPGRASSQRSSCEPPCAKPTISQAGSSSQLWRKDSHRRSIKEGFLGSRWHT